LIFTLALIFKLMFATECWIEICGGRA
jgi:hypothetical protein